MYCYSLDLVKKALVQGICIKHLLHHIVILLSCRVINNIFRLCCDYPVLRDRVESCSCCKDQVIRIAKELWWTFHPILPENKAVAVNYFLSKNELVAILHSALWLYLTPRISVFHCISKRWHQCPILWTSVFFIFSPQHYYQLNI